MKGLESNGSCFVAAQFGGNCGKGFVGALASWYVVCCAVVGPPLLVSETTNDCIPAAAMWLIVGVAQLVYKQMCCGHGEESLRSVLFMLVSVTLV